ncbi:MAG: ligase, partial [Myxococcales bacterium]|nr:ligase [Myxococcales bacterium]
MALTSDEAATRAAALRAEVVAHDARYASGRPVVADAEYDALVAELRALEAAFPELATADSPTRRVIDRAPEGGFAPLRHLAPMMSLDNVFAPDELRAWLRRVEEVVGPAPPLVCELKMDGVAVSLTYEEGVFVRGGTRGDGSVGEDVTANLRGVAGVRATLDGAPGSPLPRLIEVRGEVYLPAEAFARLNAALAGGRRFANPRNAAAG